MKVAWSDAAESDLASILSYIAKDDKAAAFRVVDRLEAAGNGLVKFPMRGRVGRSSGTRELPVPGTSYILIYQLTDDGVEVLHALHGAQDWPR